MSDESTDDTPTAMGGMTKSQLDGFNQSIVDEFRANGGTCGGMFEGNDMILVHNVGAKSGVERISPLTYHPYEGDYVIMASAGGSPTHPAWYYNLVANPDITIEVGTESMEATAVLASDADRPALYESMTTAMPRFADYQAGVDREIPMFRIVAKG
ncbi:MAG: nitroreductase family deazaflavin-dependent oxidoreductase [Actinomycetota bacterium]